MVAAAGDVLMLLFTAGDGELTTGDAGSEAAAVEARP
jgi:hypothetical protein